MIVWAPQIGELTFNDSPSSSTWSIAFENGCNCIDPSGRVHHHYNPSHGRSIVSAASSRLTVSWPALWLAPRDGAGRFRPAQQTSRRGCCKGGAPLRQRASSVEHNINHVPSHPKQLSPAHRGGLGLHDVRCRGELGLELLYPSCRRRNLRRRAWRWLGDKLVERTVGDSLNGVAPAPADFGHAGRRPGQRSATAHRRRSPLTVGRRSRTQSSPCWRC